MGTGKRDGDRRVLRSKNRGQENKGKVTWCEYAPIECTCKGTCNKKGGRH